MPSETELPPGTVRDFVRFLFELFRAADRPTLETISDKVADSDYAGTASRETVRRMLRGQSVPAQWPTAESVFLALCDLAGADPDDDWQFDGVDGTCRNFMKSLWNAAIDEPDRVWGRVQTVDWSDSPF
jgi:hypothetical protein